LLKTPAFAPSLSIKLISKVNIWGRAGSDIGLLVVRGQADLFCERRLSLVRAEVRALESCGRAINARSVTAAAAAGVASSRTNGRGTSSPHSQT
jgi:hypothetical protein